jgi:hypothetical protein
MSAESSEAPTISTVADFITRVRAIKEKQEQLGNKADLLFRGQPEDKTLLPRLGRPPNTIRNLQNREKLIFEEFKRTSLPFLELTPKTDWDFLALAQHHGLPTRLLDWTYSALTALWVVVGYKHEPDGGAPAGPGVVYVLCPSTKDFNLKTEETDPFRNDRIRTFVFRPTVVTRRIAAQAGVFTLHRLRDDHKSFMPIKEDLKHGRRLYKICVPRNQFNDLREELNRLGVNEVALFPDLDGLSKHLDWRYTQRRRNSDTAKTKG